MFPTVIVSIKHILYRDVLFCGMRRTEQRNSCCSCCCCSRLMSSSKRCLHCSASFTVTRSLFQILCLFPYGRKRQSIPPPQGFGSPVLHLTPRLTPCEEFRQPVACLPIFSARKLRFTTLRIERYLNSPNNLTLLRIPPSICRKRISAAGRLITSLLATYIKSNASSDMLTARPYSPYRALLGTSF